MTWQVGDVTVTKLTELEMHWPFHVLLPGAEDLLDGHDWLRPDFVADDGRMKLSMHALAVRTAESTIIVDTCVGNGKSRPGAPPFDNLESDFLADITAARFGSDDVDTVVCTHLHVDHVGWNTHLVDGAWVPTFGRAQYLFVTEEFEYWRDEPQDFGPVFEDSVQPVVDAGLSRLVAADHRVDSEVRLEPTPGHTPGHVSVVISSGGECAVITGDMTHHPVQFAHPDLASIADWSQEGSSATRRAAYERWSDGRLVIGTHFAGRTAGRIVADGDAWRFDVDYG
ncbi:MAG TPA: MBL fold metallo-hydrolase [Acidimicrobiaceae bacterium]|nr:MBL fold metallo-hydrolase [Acidimicrobiaceae bacterium]HCB36994.1 MBL fold metallo-hydrolase [Acidimicrobiaceae bacterium]